ncbi:MAG: rhomboid family intramembrane serine protease [Anaerolineae bacterium]
MIPYRVVGKTSFRAYTSFALILVTFAFFLWEIVITSQAGQPIEELLPQYAFRTCEVGEQPVLHMLGDGLRSLFMHTTFLAFATNMLFLWIFAPRVEEFFGHRPFAVFYIVGGFGGLVLSALMLRECHVVVGSNAAMAAVLGAFFFLSPLKLVDAFVPVLNRTMALPAVVFIIAYLAIAVFSSQGGPLSGDLAPYWDEVGGFVTGFLIAFVANFFKSAPPGDPFEYMDR